MPSNGPLILPIVGDNILIYNRFLLLYRRTVTIEGNTNFLM